ncbi:MAG: hypothetical protein KJ670_01185 [Alphaproteobacteria bacterium]|nr:hypothetical protein [Rhizobiaceae bacterium]MBU3959495.1 hypothetical protein [Alphaproteobacteria bacterium]MBU4049364.1 hypothetical protein [Alphaproteobacteria bacterium]MBU4087309.1 hypothetical protein [Alphaproteobacteria bacterium]MBU4154671.1 hypothetical protein [Alphaproteobacteria bacterium]
MGKVFLIVLLSLACVSCWPRSQEAEKLEADLFAMPTGSLARFVDLVPDGRQMVCMLSPYQHRLAFEHPLITQVNEDFAEKGFSLDEGHFAFVLIGADEIEVLDFRRSQELDVLDISQVSALPEQSLPEGLVAGECVSWADAVVAKVELGGRTFVRLGRMP